MKAEFIQRVMQIMNELGWDDTDSDAFVGSNTTKIRGHIEKVFVDAWRKAVNILPKSYFTTKDFTDSKLISDFNTGLGYVILPDDFYTLFLFKIEGWRKSVETILDSSDTMASVQANEYTRGNLVRPVCLRKKKSIRVRIDDDIILVPKDILEYYSLPKGMAHTIEEALYIPLIEPLSDSTELNEKLFTPLAYLCASMVFNIFEKQEIAQVLEAKATEIIK